MNEIENTVTDEVPDDFLSYIAQEEPTNDTKPLYQFAMDSLMFANKVHIWHWSCSSGFQHTHFEAIYDAIRDFADALVETAMSMGGQNSFGLEQSKQYQINNEPFSIDTAILRLVAYRDELTAKKKQYSLKVSLENLFADIIEKLDKEIGLLKNFS